MSQRISEIALLTPGTASLQLGIRINKIDAVEETGFPIVQSGAIQCRKAKWSRT